PVIDLAVAAHIDALFITAACRGHGGELCDEGADRYFAVLQEDLALGVDRHGQGLAILVEALRLSLRPIDRHADPEPLRRDHENDEQHQHDVDHRRHVDLAHDVSAATTPLTASAPTREAHSHVAAAPSPSLVDLTRQDRRELVGEPLQALRLLVHL